jgi:4-hydroxybenzoate polyprenyltransferase
MTLLIRPRAWWFNKVPLSVMLFLLLVDGQPFTLVALYSLVGLIGIVSCAANFGYGLNELFDRDEDRRAGRANVANTLSTRDMWLIIGLSGLLALAFAALLAGLMGVLMTIAELLLPLCYSVPPLRVKERGLLGVLADALAAHVFPAAMALAIVSLQGLRMPSLGLVLTVALWSLSTGLRGIVSHQLQSQESDFNAGLRTIVHRLGFGPVRAFVVRVILPIEILTYVAIFVQVDVTLFMKIIACVFVVYECLKYRLEIFPATVFDRKGERYIVFVDEGAYKVWAPLLLAIDAAFTDPLFLLLAPVFVLFFRPRAVGEWQQVCVAWRLIRSKLQSVRFR